MSEADYDTYLTHGKGFLHTQFQIIPCLSCTETARIACTMLSNEPVVYNQEMPSPSVTFKKRKARLEHLKKMSAQF